MTRPVRAPGPPNGRIDFDTPFGRLATAHVLSLGGDALVALVLAGSLFFSIDPSGARWRIALYLLFTMAPFALIGPLIGPAIDRARGGRQLMLVACSAARALVALTMISSAGSDSLWLFPEAFLLLVLSKSYAVAKAAIVPTTVASDAELVEANSKLQVLGGLAAFIAGAPGALILWMLGPSAVAVLCAGVFAAATVAAMRVPRTVVASSPSDPVEKVELRSSAVLSAASAMGTLRWIIGFVTFVVAFALRGSDSKPGAGMTLGRMIHDPMSLDLAHVTPPGAPPAWHFGVVIAFSGVGGLLGAAIAPRVRRHVREEYLLVSALVVASVSGLGATFVGGLIGMTILAFGVAASAAGGKQAFDAVVQRDAPAANRGRAFGRFESRFQIIWVLGAAFPSIIAVPTLIGSVIVFVAAAAGGVFYAVALRAIERGESPPRIEVSDALRIGTIRVTRLRDAFGRFGNEQPGDQSSGDEPSDGSGDQSSRSG